ncbi:MAG: PD40 domain-containing protein [Alphaproteobacteria bacterium]|nr:PD40 domain-containing protein [Alphaproteobacteria bacterium]
MDLSRDPWETAPDPLEVALTVLGGGSVRLEVTGEAPCEATVRLDALPALEPEEALRARVVPAGWPVAEAALSRAVDAGRAIRLVFCPDAATTGLRWDRLALADGRAVGDLPGAVVVWRSPETARREPPGRDTLEGARVLLAWSGRVPHEAVAARMVEGAGALGEVVVAEIGSLDALDRKLGEGFHALQILAHGDADGLHLGPEPLQEAELKRVLRKHAARLRLVVLLACTARVREGRPLATLAEALHRVGVEAVLAPPGVIGVNAAQRASAALWGVLLGELGSVERAWRAAVAHADLRLRTHPGAGPDLRPFAVPPYRGLLPFEAEHARFWFGREAERTEAVGKLEALAEQGPRLLFIYGTSGLGKSSLARAGLVPAMTARGWACAVCRPGGDGVRAALAALGEAGARLLVVDQLEELFFGDEDAAAVLGLIEEALGGGVYVVLTLRLDDASRWAGARLGAYTLDQLLKDPRHQVMVSHLGREAFSDIVLRPVERVGLRFQSGLAKRVVGEIVGEPGDLPLLEYALEQLWRHRQGGEMTHAAWDALGGVSGALQAQGAAVLEALGVRKDNDLIALSGAAHHARELLVGLVAADDDGRLHTRRRRKLSELRPASDVAPFEVALHALVDARLVVLDTRDGEPWVELAHETLCREWEVLKRWVEEDFDAKAELRNVSKLVDGNAAVGKLLQEDDLDSVRRVERVFGARWTAAQQEWIRHSLQELRQADRKRVRALRQARRKRAVLALVVVAVVGIFVVVGGRRVHDMKLVEAAEIALQGEKPIEALAFLRWAYDPWHTPGWSEAFFSAMSWGLPESTTPGTETTSRRRINPDGTILATIDREGMLTLFELGPPIRLLERVALPMEGNAYVVLGVATDGWPVVVRAGDGQTGEKKILLVDPVGIREVISETDEDQGSWARLDPTGRWLLVNSCSAQLPSEECMGPVRVFETATASEVELSWTDWVLTAAFDATGDALLAVPAHPFVLRRQPLPLQGVHPVLEPDDVALPWAPETIGSIKFRRDGRVLQAANGQENGRVVLRRVSTSDLTSMEVESNGDARVRYQDFRRPFVAMKYVDNVLRVFNDDDELLLSTGPSESRPDFIDFVHGRWWLTPGPGGRRLVRPLEQPDLALRVAHDRLRSWGMGRLLSREQDRETFLYQSPPLPMLRVQRAGSGWAMRSTISPDGRWILSTSSVGLVSIIDVDTFEKTSVLDTELGRLPAAAWSPDGRRIAIGSREGVVRVYRFGADEVILDGGSPQDWKLSYRALDVSFSPDGATLAVAQEGGGVGFLTEGNSKPRMMETDGVVWCVGFSPDGQWFAWGDDGGDVWLGAAGRPQEAQRIGHHRSRVRDLTFSSDGSTLLSGSEDGTARLWSIPDGLLLRVFSGHDGSVTAVDLSRDGRLVLTASDDHLVRVWRLDDAGEPAVIRGHDRFVLDAEFHPSEFRVVSASADGSVRSQPADLDANWPWRRYPECILNSEDVRSYITSDWMRRLFAWRLTACPQRSEAWSRLRGEPPP